MELIKKKIWLVNYYAMPPEYESRPRTIKFAHYLEMNGYSVKIISSSFLHNTNKNLITDNSKYIIRKYDDLNFIHIRTNNYKKNGISRLYSLFQFHFKLLFYRKEIEKPDIIIHTVLPPFGNILYFAAKKLKAKYVIEVLDLWPDSLVDLGVIKKGNIILPYLYRMEKWIYSKSDAIVFSQEGGKDYIRDMKWDKQRHNGSIDLKKVFYINNGVDLKDFHYNRLNNILEDEDLIDDTIKKVVYIGSIRLANNLMELIKAAEILESQNPDIKFLLYGDGDDRGLLESYCTERNIKNVIFKQKWILPKFVPYVLSKSSVNILNYHENFGKYGGSQSKLFQYIASGKPICSNLEMKYCLINKYNLGIARKYNSSRDYADAIKTLSYLDKEALAQIKVRSESVVREFDYENLTKKLIQIIEIINDRN